ncbi:Mediator of RNA polymerase II transcription subunit 12-like protein [Portunus trituberculatus]|uniref:Mediator of RNA polymerase II transcription subunit 12-like protein n=1 Tax=Portunus trituberculatus TaxID=210409 RepID=A0A5B7FYU8_PORTR|nr:Mediator of RNA polymerase II transcription subunit 12-like protein [Portunus trituberculatus]
MCTLISRGDLATGTPDLKADSSFGEKKEDGTDNIDDDLGKILQKIAVNTSLEESGSGGRGELGVEGKQRPPRHLVYAQHFPLPQDDAYMHEINQRYVLLYGVGKARDEARAAVKKLTKEISKLFSKKCSNDIAEGGKVKKSSRGEFNFENILSRFCALSYFDQHHITSTVASQVLEMLSGCGSGMSNYLPTHDHIAFLMDLMEVALNVHGLIELCIQIIKEVNEIEAQLVERGCLAGWYCPTLLLHVVGVLRKYHCCLLGLTKGNKNIKKKGPLSHQSPYRAGRISQRTGTNVLINDLMVLVVVEQTSAIFEGLCRLVKANPSECTSPERVVFSYLYDLYASCSFLKSKHHEIFSTMYPKLKQTLYASITPAQGTYRWNLQFMEDYIKNPNLLCIHIIITSPDLLAQLPQVPYYGKPAAPKNPAKASSRTQRAPSEVVL